MASHDNRIFRTNIVWLVLATLSSFLIGAIFNLFAGIGAGIAGGILWWGLIERPAKPTLIRGGLFGFLTVLFAHPLMWLIGGVFGHPIFYSIVSDSTETVFDFVTSLPQIITDAVFGGLLSLLITTFTIPIGVIAGLILVILRRRFETLGIFSTKA